MAHCKLCGKKKKLINAHIIPESFYVALDKGLRPLKLISDRVDRRPQRSQTGVYDQEILCAECDAKLGEQLEQYAHKELLHASNIERISHNGETLGYRYPNLDANRLYRFIVSIAWRASITNQEFFSSVSLGPWEKKFKSILLNEGFCLTDKGDSHDALLVQYDQENVPILNPRQTRQDGIKFLRIYAAKFCFWLKIDSQVSPSTFADYSFRARSIFDDVVAFTQEWDDSKEYQAIKQLAISVKERYGSKF